MREKHIEQKFTHAVKQAGGKALKLTSPNLAGVPDRLILMPGGRAAFAEIKAPGKKPRPLQTHRINQLTELGFTTYIIDNPNQIPDVINALHTAPIPSIHHQLHRNPPTSSHHPRNGHGQNHHHPDRHQQLDL